MHFTPEAKERWLEYQTANRADIDAASPLAEALISRLASAPAQALAVAMIFQAAMWAKRAGVWSGELSLEALDCAIDHVDACLDAAAWLDGIAERESIVENAEVVLVRIFRDFAIARRGPTIYVQRSDLTRAYCHDSSRRGALRPHELYNQIIPALITQGKARLALKDGKREVYAFRAEG